MTRETASDTPWLRALAVMTRSAERDYRWLGLPPQPWWLEFEGWIDSDQPAFICKSDGNTAWVYLHRLPSERRDHMGSGITYTAALELAGGVPAADFAARLAFLWLSATTPALEVASEGSGAVAESLGRRLDYAFPTEVIDRIMSALQDIGIPSGETRVRAILDVTSDVPHRLGSSLDGATQAVTSACVPRRPHDAMWHGGLDDPLARETLNAHVRVLAGGRSLENRSDWPGLAVCALRFRADLGGLGRDYRQLALLASFPGVHAPQRGLPGQRAKSTGAAPLVASWLRLSSRAPRDERLPLVPLPSPATPKSERPMELSGSVGLDALARGAGASGIIAATLQKLWQLAPDAEVVIRRVGAESQPDERLQRRLQMLARLCLWAALVSTLVLTIVILAAVVLFLGRGR